MQKADWEQKESAMPTENNETASVKESTNAETVAALGAVAAAAGTAAAIGALGGALANTPPVVHHVRGAAAANFGSATAHALKNHASLTSALGAGATAAVGGPAVVATITAAAPIVLGVAVGVAAVAGTIALMKWLDEL